MNRLLFTHLHCKKCLPIPNHMYIRRSHRFLRFDRHRSQCSRLNWLEKKSLVIAAKDTSTSIFLLQKYCFASKIWLGNQQLQKLLHFLISSVKFNYCYILRKRLVYSKTFACGVRTRFYANVYSSSFIILLLHLVTHLILSRIFFYRHMLEQMV